MDFKKFWKDWGISKQEFIELLGACGVIIIPVILEIIGGLLL